jgi:hypothetical protein
MKLIKLYLSLIIKTLDGKLILVNFRPTMSNMAPIVQLRNKLIKLNNLRKLNLVLNLKKTRKLKNLVPKEAKNSMTSLKKLRHGPRNTKLQMTYLIVSFLIHMTIETSMVSISPIQSEIKVPAVLATRFPSPR